MQLRSKWCIGVLGGMGPLAAASFTSRIVQLTSAPVDQDHLPVVLYNDPSIPDRSQGALGTGPSPLPAMLDGIRFLVDSGARFIAIPCNTAHLWYEQLVAASPVPVLNIVDAVVGTLKRDFGTRLRIGLLGTKATIQLNLYQRALAAAGIRFVVPSAHEIDAFSARAIAAVKANDAEAARIFATSAVSELVENGAEVVALVCTELPLALPHEQRLILKIPMRDSIEALASEAIRRFRLGE